MRTRLENERKNLLDQLALLDADADSQETRREGSPFGKREEEASESFELEKRLALERQVKEQLASIDHALDKLDKGTYGTCEECALPIDPARLEALPWARFCMSCKAKQAKEGKGR
jgi:DnaK suppressor protein